MFVSVGGPTGATGPKGDKGDKGLNWRGAWSNTIYYSIDDAVERNGSSYICILAHINQQPPNSTYWNLFTSGGGAGVCYMKTGTYIGSGTDDRNIDIGVNLTNKTYKWVCVFSVDVTQAPMNRIEYGQGDYSRSFIVETQTSNNIQSFTTTGFQVGSSNRVNQNGYTYYYIAFWVI